MHIQSNKPLCYSSICFFVVVLFCSSFYIKNQTYHHSSNATDMLIVITRGNIIKTFILYRFGSEASNKHKIKIK